MACRFPGASDEEALWNLLDKGIDAVSEVPPERWDVDDYYDPDPDAPGRISTRFGGFIQGIDLFDQQLFGIAPREIASMDPQHRLLLETTWEALERSCINPRGLTGTRTGVFMGISTSDYAHLLSARGDQAIDAYLGTGTAHSTGVGRVSYTFGFEGPNLAIDTACSSSLVAIHQACQSLRSGESDLALAGGVNAILVPSVSIGFSKARMLAPDGRCKSFDASADGYARGEGCGIVVLKRLADAERDGDRILAVIRGSAVNQDGASSGPTVPNGPAQERVIRDALAQASCKPKDVSYLEAHGTGTSLGDPIEIRAAAAVYGQDRDPKQPLLVGTIKTNIGHLEAAAGVAGVIKVVLAMRKKRVPRQLHFEKGNPHIPWDEMPLKVTAESVEWPQPEKLAAVSSFGFSGTNAHVVLESVAEAPVSVTSFVRRRYLLPLSASSLKGLRELAARWRCWVSSNPELDLADMCYSAAVGRAHLEERAALECDSVEGAVALLTTLEADQSAPGLYRGTARRRFTLETIPEDAETVARQYVRGADIDFAAWYGEPKPRKIALPVYPFQRKRFWFDEMPLPTISANGLLYELQWRPLPALAVHEASGEWLVAGDRNFFGDRRTIGTGTPRGTIYFVDDESIHQFPQLFRTLRAPIHIVTRGAQAVSNEDVVRPSQSMFWGIGKSLSLERPDLRGSLIDLPADADATWAAHLIGHLQAHRSEDQTALRRQGSFAARLTPLGLGKPETIAPPISGTWLITGGTGALGRRLANWLKTRGATHVVLAGRRAPASTADGCTFLAADVSSEDEVQSLIAEIDRELPPLSGIIHAAGILEEGRLGEQTSESFEAVLAPKARGAWNLHLATKDRNLDYFICVSSIASVWGSPGQSAYAAANAFLDGLAEHRRAKGLAALTVNFGPWGGGGLADKRSRAALAQQGIRTMGPTRAIAALESLLSAGRGHAIVADINWPVFSAVYQARRERPLFSELPVLTASARSIRASGTLTELNGAPPGERRKLLERHLREVVASILRLSATDLDPEMGFAGLGMDSLMAVELRKRLQETFGASVVLSTTLGFDYPTIRELAAYLLSALYPPDPVSTAEADLLRLHEATSEAELDALIEENVRALEAGHG
jgi:acyl transferase domain-containing protein/acyl carrier protein